MEFDDILKFLDCAIESTKQKARSLENLDDKVIYHSRANDLEKTRRVLLGERYAFEDYIENGKYEVPEIKTECITIKIRK